MIFDLVIKNAKVVTPTGVVAGDLGVHKGVITKIGSISQKGTVEKDAAGKFLLPGGIDMHVHFRDPGHPAAEDFGTGSAAAAAGGITTVIDMPNTNPPTTTLQALEEKRHIAAKKSHVNYGFFFGYTGRNLDEIKRAVGIMGVKVYMAHSTGGLLVQDGHLLEKLYALGKLVIIHAENETIIRENREAYGKSEDPSVHSVIRSEKAAFEATRMVLHLAKKCEARVHITHLSTAHEVEELKKFRSPEITADATPHHLFLTQSAYRDRGNFVKVNPPLRTEEDRQALWKGLRDNTISAVASDHAPHEKSAKEQSYSKAPAGVPGVETLLPLLLDAANHGELTLPHVVNLASANPAKILGLAKKGRLEAGYDADLVLVDMEEEREVGAHGFFTKCGWSPFAGMRLKGWPVLTVVNGGIVFEDGKIQSTVRGKEAQ